MRNIKAIKTKYKHNWFRSRLEAKWAKYFDLLGIEYEYEPEGFVFEDDTYLPDFKIMGNLYVEVKPTIPSLEYFKKLHTFILNKDCCLLLLVGEPKPGDHIFLQKDHENSNKVIDLSCFINVYTFQKWGPNGIYFGEYYFNDDDDIYQKDLKLCRLANNINNF